MIRHEAEGFTYVIEEGSGSRLLICLHGTGGDEESLIGFARTIAPDATLVGVRGRAPEGDVNRWFARHAPGVLNEEDLLQRTHELASFVQSLSASPTLRDSAGGSDSALKRDSAGRKMVAFGFSNGANIAASLLLAYPGLLDAAVLFRAMMPFRESLPFDRPDLGGTPVYLATGESDSMIPRESSDRLADTLRDCGADLVHEVSERGHRFSRAEVEAAGRWLARL